MIERLKALRVAAAARGDQALVSEIDFCLAEYGYEPEMAVADVPQEKAVRPRRKK